MKDTKLLILAVLVFFLVSSARSVVIGIDFGHEWTKVAIVKPGMPLEVVLNVESKRKTPNAVIVYENETFVGDPALALAGRYPHKVLSKTQRLLGQAWKSPLVNAYQTTEAPVLVEDSRGMPAFSVDDRVVSVEAATALLLKQAKLNAERFADTTVKDCVIAVPVFYTQHERTALLNAAQLAGLNVLSLINDNTAVAVNYGVLRPIDEKPESPRRVLFYDMGAGSTKVSYIEFFSTISKSTKKKNTTIPTCEVKAVAFDRLLGGETFEDRLLTDLVKQFNGQKNVEGDVTSSQRAMARLRTVAARTKQVLSANVETPVNAESLLNDIDFRGFVKRSEFEGSFEDLLPRVVAPVQAVLDSAGISKDDLDEVILVGGGARIPKIQEHLKNFLGRDALNKNINADEAAVLGAALYGATLSAAFRVKPFKTKDISPFAIGVTYDTVAGESVDNDGQATLTKTTTLFRASNKLPSKKSMTFKRTEDFEFSVDYLDEDLLPVKDSAHLAKYRVLGVAEALEKNRDRLPEDGESKIKVSFRLSNGVLSLLKAELVFNQTITEVVDDSQEGESSWLSNAKEYLFGDDDDSEVGDGNMDTNLDPSDGGDTPTEDDSVFSDEYTESKTETTAESEDPQQPEGKKAETAKVITKLKERRVKLDVDVVPSSAIVPLSSDDLKNIKEQLKQLAEQDERRKHIAKARNELESTYYGVREQMEDEEFEEACTEEEREALSTFLAELSDWIDFDVESAGLDDLSSKLEQLRGHTHKIYVRVEEGKKRPEEVKTVKEALLLSKKFLKDWTAETEMTLEEDEEPRLSVSELDSLKEHVDDLENWLEEQEEKQSKLKPNEDPAFTVAELHQKGESLARKLTYYSRKPKPAMKKPVVPPLTPISEDTEENDPPVFTTPAVVEAAVNFSYFFVVNATDPDDGDQVSITAEVLPSWLTLNDLKNGSAILSGTPEKKGKPSVVLVATDVAGLTDRMEFTIFVSEKKMKGKARKAGKSSKTKVESTAEPSGDNETSDAANDDNLDDEGLTRDHDEL